MNLIDFQIAVINGENNTATEMLMEIDRKTEREYFKKAANHFGFSLLDAEGVFYASRSQLAPIFGFQDESGIRRMCERQGISEVALGRFGQNVRIKAHETFNLNPKDNKTVFVDYAGFLTIGAKGTTEQSRQVFAYLLQMERAGRIAIGAKDLVNQEDRKLKNASKIVDMLSKVDKIKNQHLKRKAAEHLDEILDGALDLGKQSCLFE